VQNLTPVQNLQLAARRDGPTIDEVLDLFPAPAAGAPADLGRDAGPLRLPTSAAHRRPARDDTPAHPAGWAGVCDCQRSPYPATERGELGSSMVICLS
jgi:hypothetical protein